MSFVSRYLALIIFLFFRVLVSDAQTIPDTSITPVTDSLTITDTIIKIDPQPTQPVVDSVAPKEPLLTKRPRTGPSWNLEPGANLSWQQLAWQVLGHHPWMGFSAPAFTDYSAVRQFHGKEIMFYGMVALLLLFAVLRSAFPKYYNDLFRLFFRTTLKQRQIREQLMQTPLPSLLMNAFFIITAGLYIAFVLRHYGIDPVGNFWLMSLYCSLGLSVAYFVKFLGLKISGWLFNMPEAAASYIFIVFVVNKMIGILLLPFLILLAFTQGDVYTVALNLSYCLLAGLLAYRFILTFAAVRNQVRVNPFHFFLYLCAFEIAPLLLVYKGLLVYFRQTA